MPRPKRVQPDSAVAAETGALADRLRAALPAEGRSEQKMFGGIGFMLNGNMVAGTSKRGLLLRVGKERYEDALSRPGARPMDMRSRPVEGYVYVDPAVLDDKTLRDWLQLALAFVKTLPPKQTAQAGADERRAGHDDALRAGDPRLSGADLRARHRLAPRPFRRATTQRCRSTAATSSSRSASSRC